MKHLPVLLVILLSVGTLTAQNDDSWRKDGKPLADTPNTKSKSGFGAQLFLTEDEQFFENWSKPATPKLKTVEKAHRNLPIFTVILFVDPGRNGGGEANVTCDITVRKPDGGVYGEQKDIIGWKGEYLVPAHNIQLAEGRMGIVIEPRDPSGKYTVEAAVHDHIKKIDLLLKIDFDVP